eukprot:TRINITY_DN5425_c0_g1_i2.p1 TRINITY_DN5425_c0_g1~~TRINITY_DN5425_c0_g1_i2.p1  ORF type:complete len:129 (-),score=40.71 TRINITY_DN5425_c0_g1_i2:99-485(-)
MTFSKIQPFLFFILVCCCIQVCSSFSTLNSFISDEQCTFSSSCEPCSTLERNEEYCETGWRRLVSCISNSNKNESRVYFHKCIDERTHARKFVIFEILVAFLLVVFSYLLRMRKKHITSTVVSNVTSR